MLTELQKEDIAAKLKQKYNEYYKFIFDLGSMMFKVSGRFDIKNVVHYGKAHVFVNGIEKFKGNLLGKHYYYGLVRVCNGKIEFIEVGVYLNNTTRDCTNGCGQYIGWIKGEDGGVRYCIPTEKWLCENIGLSRDDTIKEFVFKNADTNPLGIVKVSKWLDLPFKKELVKMVECFINESSKVYAIASNEAADIEALNDNILLEEFGLKNVATPINVKSYKLTLKEVTKKK